jgi:hypothetical protein
MEDSSDLNDSDVDELLDNGMEHMFVLLAPREFAERKKRKPPGSKVGRLCIARNHALGHDLLMRDYFIEVPTYPAHLFRLRYRMWRSLFAEIVKTCEEKTRYFKGMRNAAGLLGFSAY